MEPDISGMWERLGVAGIIVVAAYFLLRYFMAQLDKKEGRVSDLTDRFLKATEMQTMALSQSTMALSQSTAALAQSTAALALNTAALLEVKNAVCSMRGDRRGASQ
jgi:hypothetical protein